MVRPLRIHFVIADGGRARWVERSAVGDGYVTMMQLTASHRAPGHPEGVVFEGGSGQRFTVDDGDRARRDAGDFAREVAELINARAAAGGVDRLALVAPARFLNEIRDRLSTSASARLVGSLAKDLTHTPDHELGTWLHGLELG